MDGIIDTIKPFLVRMLAGEHIQSILLHGRQHRVSIAAAVALISSFGLYRSITRVPHQLAHLPHLGFFDYLKALIERKSIDDIARQLTLPIAMKSDSGLYVRFDRDGWSVHIVNPEAAKRFLLKQDVFPKTDRTKTKDTLLVRFTGARQIVSLNGHEWKAQRKVANPAFHRSMPINLFGRLTGKLFNLMDGVSEQGKAVDFHDAMERWTLDAIGLAAFDFDFHALDDKDNEWVSRYATIMGGVFDPLYLTFPSLDTWFLPFNPARKHKHTEVDKLLAMIDQIIVKKRKMIEEQKQESDANDSEKDLLTLMLESEMSGEGTMSNQELRNNVVVFFVAGHDTTANALSTAVYELAVNPDVQSKARQEAIHVLGDGPEDVTPTVEQMREMPYMNQIIKENLRTHPPAPAVGSRTTTEDTELCGTFIPKGSRVVVDIYEMHHSSSVWSEPEEFRPERFGSGGEADQRARQGMSWLPFSNGGRQCLGMNFSLAEQRVLLPMLLRKYEWFLPEDSIHKNGLMTGGLSVVTSPKNLHIVFKPRY